MNFTTYKPCPALADTVSYYWTLSMTAAEKPHTERVYATGGISVIFHYGVPFVQKNPDGETVQQHRSLLCGQSLTYSDVLALPQSGMIGAVLFPHALRAFSSIPMRNLTNRDIRFGELFPGFGDLEDRLCEAHVTAERICLLDRAFLTLLLQDRGKHYSTVNEALRLIEQSGALLPEQSILDALELNERTLQRIFSEYIGLSPHEFISLRRINHAISGLTGCSRLTDVAYNSDFYDQSHFIKSFKKITGCTPGEFRKICCTAKNS
ncbi:MAG: helix-turn-helix domain-containing protein [Spirochaetota bacterium]